LEAFLGQCLASDQGDLYAEAHRQLDRFLLTRVLDDTGGNQHQAARRLGIARETLRRRLRELGLHVSRQLSADEDDPA
jgi:DNA-binding protein Fis